MKLDFFQYIILSIFRIIRLDFKTKSEIYYLFNNIIGFKKIQIEISYFAILK